MPPDRRTPTQRRAARLARIALSALAPPLCALCGRACVAGRLLCEGCRAAVAASPGGFAPVPGLDAAWAASAYEGAPRRLVAALKLGGRLPLARYAAGVIAAGAPPGAAAGALVPVPRAPGRARRRGFDPAGEIAAALSACLALPLDPCLCRGPGPRQVGRRRADRLGDPPRIAALRAPLPVATLVDDVITTGATLSASAAALRAAGAVRVAALAFARTPAHGGDRARPWAS